MTSLWKDLLFLHGHLVHQQDLQWRHDTAPGRDVADAAAPGTEPVTCTPPRQCAAAGCA